MIKKKQRKLKFALTKNLETFFLHCSMKKEKKTNKKQYYTVHLVLTDPV